MVRGRDRRCVHRAALTRYDIVEQFDVIGVGIAHRRAVDPGSSPAPRWRAAERADAGFSFGGRIGGRPA